MVWVLVAVGFPTTLASCYVMGGIAYAADAAVGGFVGWAILSASGALQWFVILPWIWRKCVTFTRRQRKLTASNG
jgi:hypothetical protein